VWTPSSAAFRRFRCVGQSANTFRVLLLPAKMESLSHDCGIDERSACPTGEPSLADAGRGRTFGPGGSAVLALHAVLGGEDLADPVAEGPPSAFVVANQADGVAAQVGCVGVISAAE
jgi:hypothetical protein